MNSSSTCHPISMAENLNKYETETAKLSNLLIFSRDPDPARMNFAQKVRSLFNKVYFSAENSDCQKLLETYNNVTLHDALRIDIVVLEYDTAASKLIDYINRRSYISETSNCPAIPMIVLFPSDTDLLMAAEGAVEEAQEEKDKLRKLGVHVLVQPITDDILLADIRNILSNNRRFEESYSNLQQTRVTTTKYPFMPIFDHIQDHSTLSKYKNKHKDSSVNNGIPSSSSTSVYGHENDEKNNIVKQMKLNIQEIQDSIYSSTDRRDSSRTSICRKVSNTNTSRPDTIGEVKYREINEDVEEDEEDEDDNDGEDDEQMTMTRLLNPECRPFWIGDHSHDIRKKNVAYEISPFVDRPKPNLTPKTIGGLDKHTVDHHWRVLNDPRGDSAPKSRPTTSNSPISTRPSSGKLQPLRSPSSDLAEQLSSIDLLNNNIPTLQRSDKSILNATNRASRILTHVTRSSKPDYQVSRLIELDFSTRKINAGEKDMLERGRHLELDGDYESAEICYKRAGVHSKDPHLAKLLIGNLHYSQDDYFKSLYYYSQAIKHFEGRPISLQSKQDEYLLFYNRSIIHLRLGNDEMGLKDMERASLALPNDLKSRDILTIAKRRLGRFHNAIEDAIIGRSQRADFERNTSPVKTTRKSLSSPRRSDGSVLGSPSMERSKTGFMDSLMSRSVMLEKIPDVLPSSCGTSLRDRVAGGMMSTALDDRTTGDGTNMDGGFLKLFKMNQGQKMDLFEELFQRPSELQRALLTPPSERSKTDISIITDSLALFPLLRKMSKDVISELSKEIEYRVVNHKEELFTQDGNSTAVCLLLDGAVQTRMDISRYSTIMDVVIDNLPPYSAFGHIDLLFRQRKMILFQTLESIYLDHGKKFGVNPNNHPSISTSSPLGLTIETTENNNRTSNSNTNVISPPDENLSLSPNRHFSSSADWSRILPDVETSSHLDLAHQSHRALHSGMFVSHFLQSSSQLLLVNSDLFERFLLPIAIQDLKDRLNTLISCGIFVDWPFEDFVRLARMATVRTVNRGEVILAQGSRPDGLYFIMRGLVKIKKQPNRTEMLHQKLKAVQERAERHDLKYAFHHEASRPATSIATSNNRNGGTRKGAIISSGNSTSGNSNTRNHNATRHGMNNITNQSPSKRIKKEIRKFPTTVPLVGLQPTAAECDRAEMAQEIQKLESLIISATAQENARASTANFNKRSSSSRNLSTKSNLTKSQSLSQMLDNTLADVATLQWPMIFGELCVLDPDGGSNRGMVIADTSCELLILHKAQLQTFRIDERFLEHVKAKSVFYPDDPKLVVNLFRQSEWKLYREEIMQDVDRRRWPPRLNAIEPFVM